MEVGFKLSGDFGMLSECRVVNCLEYDYDSEGCCWSGLYNRCKVRLIIEGGVLYVDMDKELSQPEKSEC